MGTGGSVVGRDDFFCPVGELGDEAEHGGDAADDAADDGTATVPKSLATSEVSTFRKSVTKPEELGLAFPIGGVGPHRLEARLPRRLPSISCW